MERGGFGLKFVSKLKIKSKKVNERKSSSYIKSPGWLRYRKGSTKSKEYERMMFHYAFALTQHFEEINYCEQVLNIKSVIDLYNRKGKEYPTSLDSNNYTLFQKKNLEIPLCCMLM